MARQQQLRKRCRPVSCVVKSVCGNSSNISHSCSGVIVLLLRDLLQNHSRAGSEIVYEYFSQYRQYHQTFCAAVQAPLLPDHQLLVREGPLRTNSAVFFTLFKRGEAGSNTCYKKLLQILYDLMINCIKFLYVSSLPSSLTSKSGGRGREGWPWWRCLLW